MSSSTGTKVTTDPKTHQNPKIENPGEVLADSLAAESIRSGGQFAAGSSSRGPSGQPSHSTTTNTTDTSNATVLPAARDAPARLSKEEHNEAAELDAGRQPVPDASNSIPVSQPKGANLREGGFDPDAPNASFTTDIGSKKDPGRVALGVAQQKNLPVAGGDGGPRQVRITKDGQFDVLKDTSA